MGLFYIILILVIVAGFVTGFKTGFIKSVSILFTAVVALGCSCFFYIPFSAQTADWWDVSDAANKQICFATLFLFTMLLLLFTAKPLRWFSKHNNRTGSKIAGGILGAALLSLVFIILIILTGFIEMPAVLTAKLEETGVSSTAEAGADLVNNLFAPSNSTKKEQVLASNSTGNEAEKRYDLAFAEGIKFNPGPGLEKEMLQLVNQERKKKGLPFLSYDSALTFAARKHAADMLTRRYFSHNTPEGITPFQRLHNAKISYRFAGENLAFAPTVLKAHQELMLSPGHRANILNRQYKRAGIAVMQSDLAGVMVVQEFRD